MDSPPDDLVIGPGMSVVSLQMQSMRSMQSLCERLMAFWVAQGSRRLHPTQVGWRRLLSGASNPWLTEKEDFGFKRPSRLEQIGDKQASQAPQSEASAGSP